MTVLSIIILSYNTKDLILKCLSSIFSNYKKELKEGLFEVIIVDNASTDGSIERIKNYELGIKPLKLIIIKNGQNVGFAKGINIGAKEAKGKYLFFLNSDTELKNDKLKEMVVFLKEHAEVGILGAKMVNENGSPEKSTGKFFNLLNTILMLAGGERFGMLRFSPNKNEIVDWVSGGAMMIKSELFKKLSGFDEGFFMYVEDMDLCFRAKNLGFSTSFFLKAVIFHKQHGSSSREYAIFNIYKGISYFFRNRKPYWQYLLIKGFLKTKATFAFFIGSATGNSNLKNTYSKAAFRI